MSDREVHQSLAKANLDNTLAILETGLILQRALQTMSAALDHLNASVAAATTKIGELAGSNVALTARVAELEAAAANAPVDESAEIEAAAVALDAALAPTS